ncbi:MAG: hypothetical protein JWR41_1572, partial [Modestobacter sp.]|nr:hypothetical protein [Modestobacter sp.]
MQELAGLPDPEAAAAAAVRAATEGSGNVVQEAPPADDAELTETVNVLVAPLTVRPTTAQESTGDPVDAPPVEPVLAPADGVA